MQMRNNSRALYIYNATVTVGEVQISNWSNNVGQEWMFTSQGNNTFSEGLHRRPLISSGN
jgi:hypothetical protein